MIFFRLNNLIELDFQKIFVFFNLAPPTCEPNQVYTATANHPCRDTCDEPNLSQVCDYSPYKYPGCICVDVKGDSCIE